MVLQLLKNIFFEIVKIGTLIDYFVSDWPLFPAIMSDLSQDPRLNLFFGKFHSKFTTN